MFRRAFLIKTLFLLIGFSLGFVLLEIFCRLVSPAPKIDLKGLTRAPSNSLLPCELTPSFVGNNNGIEIQINSLGWRDREWNAKQSDQTRILLVGDSFVLGLNVPSEHLLGKQLEKCFQNKIEICMAGCIYYNTSHELLAVQQLVPILKPDLIIVSYVLNDAEPSRVSNSTYHLYHNIESWLTEHSRLLFFTRFGIHYAVGEIQPLIGANDYSMALYKETQPGWQENKKSIKEFAVFSQENNIPVCFVIWPLFYDLQPSHRYKFLYKKIEAALQEANLPYLNLFNAFLYQDAHALWVSRFDPHPNSIAYQIASRAIADFIIQNNFLKSD